MRIPDALIGWSTGPGPLYVRLSRSIHGAVARGELPPGTMLPPERTMATHLAVGRSTVVAAYDVLRERGILVSRRGSGTWVAGAQRNADVGARPASLRSAALDEHTLIDLATARLPAGRAVRSAVSHLDVDVATDFLESSGYSPLGLPELRCAVADMYTEQGLITRHEQVLITTGSQQALSLIIGHGVDPGDTVVVEDPTSPGLLDLVSSSRAFAKGVPSVGAHGPEPLLDALQGTRQTLAFLMSAGGAGGHVVDASDMNRLGRALGSSHAIVVEDASCRDLTSRPPPPYLAQSGPRDQVVTIGSMSKLFWGGLRVGWIRAEERVVHRLGKEKRRLDLGTPLLSQVVSVRLLRQLNEVATEQRALIEARLTTAEALLRLYLPDWGYERPRSGVTIWLRLPRGTSGPFTELARRYGVAVVAGDSLSLTGSSDAHIRVAIGAEPDILAVGFQCLAKAWADYGTSSHVREGPW